MLINTEKYTLEFPKYAKKIRTKITPSTISDKKQISQVLKFAKINFIEQENEYNNEIIGVEGKHSEVLSKLKTFLNTDISKQSSIHSIARRLCDDLQFRFLLG